jgi:prepilin-type N-terminal cleavage/methylation domain-containing protein/prepilin-type processing-associated H-X9-DG protein
MKIFSRKGFTLVELLVVIAIIATLAALGTVVAGKMMRKGKAVKSISNMRQMGVVMAGYAVDNNNSLPPARGEELSPSGEKTNLYWHQAIMAQLRPENFDQILSDNKWWATNDVIAKNPLMDKRKSGGSFDIKKPGYGINHAIRTNFAKSPSMFNGSGAQDGNFIDAQKIPLSWFSEPARTPLIIPHDNWDTDRFLNGSTLANVSTSKQFMVDGKLNILFVDGHCEEIRFLDGKEKSLPISEYAKKNLDKMPAREGIQ